MLIVGAGPAGLFAAFQLRLFGIDCLLVEAVEQPGGQLTALYSDKPIFDAPGFISILAGDLVERLSAQAGLDPHRLIMGARVETVSAQPSGFSSSLSNGDAIQSKAIILATGGGVLGSGPSIDGGDRDEPLAVDTQRFETAHRGIFAIGDGSNYPGKLRLILSAFHEAALVTQAIRQLFGSAVQSVKRRSGGRRRTRTEP